MPFLFRVYRNHEWCESCPSFQPPFVASPVALATESAIAIVPSCGARILFDARARARRTVTEKFPTAAERCEIHAAHKRLESAALRGGDSRTTEGTSYAGRSPELPEPSRGSHGSPRFRALQGLASSAHMLQQPRAGKSVQCPLEAEDRSGTAKRRACLAPLGSSVDRGSS